MTTPDGPSSGAGPAGVVGCLVVAAGSGARLGADRPKAFVLLAGRTLLEHAVQRALGSGAVHQVVAVVPADLVAEAVHLLPDDVSVVAGGPDRSASVAHGLAALAPDVTRVLVHDAARCLAPPSLFAAVAAALDGCAAVVPGLPVVDTVKQVDADGVVVGTPDRSALRVVQTPQGFERALLERAHQQPAGRVVATDDAGLVERLGRPVHVVPGDVRAAKITTAVDLTYARWQLAREAAPGPPDA